MKRTEKDSTQFVAEEKTPSEDRLVMLCDGVFAIAITLLVLDIGINIPKNASPDVVNRALPGLIAPTISYLVTFVIIAVFWRFHRYLMHSVRRLDRWFFPLTFLFLAFIAFFPVTSKLLGDYGDDPNVVIIYTLTLSGCAFSALALWVYATWKHRLVDPTLSQDEINTYAISLLVNPLFYCLSLLLLLIIPAKDSFYIFLSWLLIGLLHRLVRFIYKHRPRQSVREHRPPQQGDDAASTPASEPDHTLQKQTD